jgi:hypothetical protein
VEQITQQYQQKQGRFRSSEDTRNGRDGNNSRDAGTIREVSNRTSKSRDTSNRETQRWAPGTSIAGSRQQQQKLHGCQQQQNPANNRDSGNNRDAS